jgi:Holliday junction resolvase-like predicted endonuclease
VAYDGSVLAFIEVKARRNERFGAPQTAVTADKRRRLTRVALAYLAGMRPAGRVAAPRRADEPSCRFDLPSCRFDLVIIESEGKRAPHPLRISLLKDVFSPSGDGG